MAAAKQFDAQGGQRSPRGVPRGVWALGVVSLLMDLSSEMIHSLLPIFLVSVLGTSAAAVGVLEGVAEALVLVVKMVSGTLSDWLGQRKSLALLGYGLAALTKPLFPLADSFALVFVARLIDRVGKGIRDAPRDALITDLSPEAVRGASFGLRQSLDTVGAIGGPLAATVIMLASAGSFRLVFWVAVLPAIACVAVLALFVKEPSREPEARVTRPRLDWRELRHFSRAFRWIVAIGGVLTLARFSEAFLVLRARDLGLGLDYVPLVMVAMNIVYAASAYPAGMLSDRLDRRLVLAGGMLVLVGADLVLARAAGTLGLLAGVALWGLHMGLSQGLLAALVADAAPADRRGTAFGFFNLASGAVLLMASVLAGELWDHFGSAATFYAGALFAALALAGLAAERRSAECKPRS
jgi:MFS family permease